MMEATLFGIMSKNKDSKDLVFALFGTQDTTVNCKDEYLEHYTKSTDFKGGHRIDPDTTLNLIVPKSLNSIPQNNHIIPRFRFG